MVGFISCSNTLPQGENSFSANCGYLSVYVYPHTCQQLHYLNVEALDFTRTYQDCSLKIREEICSGRRNIPAKSYPFSQTVWTFNMSLRQVEKCFHYISVFIYITLTCCQWNRSAWVCTVVLPAGRSVVENNLILLLSCNTWSTIKESKDAVLAVGNSALIRSTAKFSDKSTIRRLASTPKFARQARFATDRPQGQMK